MKFFTSLAAIALLIIPAKSNARPMVGDLMAEKLYYAEGRQHPGHPLHGSQVTARHIKSKHGMF